MDGHDDESRIDETRESIDQSIGREKEKGEVVRACVVGRAQCVESRISAQSPKHVYTQKKIPWA